MVGYKVTKFKYTDNKKYFLLRCRKCRYIFYFRGHIQTDKITCPNCSNSDPNRFNIINSEKE